MNIKINNLEVMKNMLEGKVEIPSKKEIIKMANLNGIKAYEDKDGCLYTTPIN